MKKFSFFVAVICCFVVVFLVSCTQPAPPPETTQTPPTQTSASPSVMPSSGSPSSTASPAVSGTPAPSGSPSVDVSSYIGKGQTALVIMKYEDALNNFTKAVEADKNNFQALNLRAETYWFLKMYPQALQDVEQAIKLKPDYSDAFRVRGAIYYSQEKFDAAQADFEKSITLDPKNHAAVLGKAKTLTALGKYKEALDLIKKEKAAMSDTLPAEVQEAAIRKKMRDFSGAIEINKKLLEKDPQAVHFIAEIGQCMALDNKPEEAIKYFEQAEKTAAEMTKNGRKFAAPGLNSTDLIIGIKNNKIAAYVDLGQYDKAVAECEKLLEETGENHPLVHNYAYSLYRMGKEKEAAVQMTKWLKIRPNPITAEQYIDWGDALFILKDYANAEKKYAESEKLDPANSNLYAKMGLLYLTMKDNKKAKLNLEKALSMGLGKADADFAKKNLSKIQK